MATIGWFTFTKTTSENGELISPTEETWHKHLEFIQSVMTGMARNSYLLKGWTVTLVAATLALSITTPSVWIVLIAALPTLVFCFLDAYYLRQEKLFRELYNEVRSAPDQVEDFSLNTDPYDQRVPCTPSLIFTVSVWPFYLVILLAIGAASIVRYIYLA